MILTLRVLLSHWRHAPLQLGLLILGLALATALWSAVQAINSEARASYSRAVEQLGTRDLPSLTAPDGDIPLATYVALRRAGWQVSPVLEGVWTPAKESLTLLGVDVLSYPGAALMAQTTPATGLDPLAVLRPPGTLYAHPDTLAHVLQDTGPRVMALQELPQGIVLTDLSVAERLLGTSGRLSRILILPDQPMGLLPLTQLVPELELSTTDDGALGDPQRLTQSFHLNLTAFGLLAFGVGLFIVQGSVTLSVEQRRGTIHTLRCLGVPVATLIQALLLELVLLALVAGVLGLVLGYIVAGFLLPDVNATLRGLYGAPVAGALSLRPGWVLSGLGMALAGTGLAGLQALLTLKHMATQLTQASQAVARRRAGLIWIWAIVGLLLIGLAGGMLWGGNGLVAGFVGLAGLMLGCALLLPPSLFWALTFWLRMTRRPVLRWLIADSRLQLPGLSLSLMALLLAIATNIGVGTMVSSFRLTFTGWIDQRLAADLYVEAAGPQQAQAILTWAEARGARSLPQYRWTTRSASAPLLLYGVVDDPLYRQNWPLLRSLPDAWDRLHSKGAVLINEQLAHRADLAPGDMLALGPDWSARIVGIYSDYGNPDGQAIAGITTLQQRAVPLTLRRIGLVPPDGETPEGLAAALRQDLALPASAILAKDRIRAASVAVFDRTFVVTAALNVLTLGVAGFAMLTSFLSQWSRRLPQLAPVWAMGVSRRQLAGLELLRSLGLALLTFVLALPLGLGLAWVLLTVINLEAFGWRLPMFLFPADWARLLGLTGAAAGIAALLPILRLLHIPPARLLGVFSNDR
ncbi:FtsX-like permease family protein [Tritonibacter horizontis]|uniref:FtsX-like permease family protein n=1 Tax=Tritonibacter horizontis TaxID=1768241 RepID=A0A132BWC1_9RHOB|nr:FtsX-like permease family protein [Tritonibacter horizontis]KUP92671.1 FtsX-like permease family protein [Tritonibacter horizontis]